MSAAAAAAAPTAEAATEGAAVEQQDESSIELKHVTIEDAGVACKKVTIEIPASVIDQRINENFSVLQTEARLPGFRPGKAPRKLIERRFSKGVMEETRSRLLRDAFTKAIQDNKLRVISDPVIKDADKIELTLGRDLTFTFEIDVMPEFDLPNLEGVAIRRPILSVTAEMVDDQIGNQQQRRGAFIPVEPEHQQPGDYFFGKANLLNDKGEVVGVVAETITRLPLEADADTGPVGGIRVTGLTALLSGKKAGDIVTVETTGPANHELESVRSQPIKIEFHITASGRLIPATMEQLLEMSGVESEEVLRSRIEKALELQIAGEQRDIMRRQVAKYLTDKTEMDLPDRASAVQTARTIEQFRLNMLNQGVEPYMIEERMADIREASVERAGRDLKLMFVMERLCEENEIRVTENEINTRIYEIARNQNVRPEALRNELARSGRGNILATQLRHEKMADKLLEKASITEMSAEDWNKEMEVERKAAEEAARTRPRMTSAAAPADTQPQTSQAGGTEQEDAPSASSKKSATAGSKKKSAGAKKK